MERLINWKYILILAVFTIFVGVLILSYANHVGKEIASISNRFEINP